MATVQCGGNRRGELNAVRKTSGNARGCGAISTAEWTGVRLRDVFAARGLGSADAAAAAGVRHVQFEGDDGVKASVPVEKALSSHGDVLLAYEMNGEPLPADHGYPLRAVVPGHVGVRNVKWLKSVTAAADEADGVWQQGIAYKSFSPAVTTLDGLDVAAAPPMQETPVTSVILRPAAGALPAEAGATSLEVSGIAYSGGGRAIIRVDVSADGGRTWTAAELGDGADQPLSSVGVDALDGRRAAAAAQGRRAQRRRRARVPRGGRVVQYAAGERRRHVESARAGEQRVAPRRHRAAGFRRRRRVAPPLP